MDWSGARFSKSTRSSGQGGDCVEVAVIDGTTGVRDSKNPEDGVLEFHHNAWRAFLADVKAGRFDRQ